MTGGMLPRDPVLPQLPVLFDTGAMAARLTAHLAALSPTVVGGWNVRRCTIERVKYRPQRNCVIGYRLGIERRSGQPASTRRVCVAAYAPAEGAARFGKAEVRYGAGGGFPPPVSHIASLDALLWSFPVDRKLPSLPLLSDGRFVREHCLPDLIERHWGPGWKLSAARTQVVGYFPEHGCTVRSRVQLVNPSAGLTRRWTVYGQTRYDDAGAKVQAAMRALSRHEAMVNAAVARPLGYDAARRILWQEAVDAPTLDRALAGPRAARVDWLKIGAAVAELHSVPLGLQPWLTGSELVAQLERARDVVTRTQPDQAGAIGTLVDALLRSSHEVDLEQYRTIHGDLHSKNLLVAPSRICFIDLDRISAGVPLAEVASLAAELVYRDCVAEREVRWETVRTLVEGYRRRAGRPVAARELGWHLAAALVRERAYRCVTSLKPGRLPALPRLLAAAAWLLDGGYEQALAGGRHPDGIAVAAAGPGGWS